MRYGGQLGMSERWRRRAKQRRRSGGNRGSGKRVDGGERHERHRRNCPTHRIRRDALVRQATQRCPTEVYAELDSRDWLYNGLYAHLRPGRCFDHLFASVKTKEIDLIEFGAFFYLGYIWAPLSSPPNSQSTTMIRDSRRSLAARPSGHNMP